MSDYNKSARSARKPAKIRKGKQQMEIGACMFGPIYFLLNKNLKNVHFGSLQRSSLGI